MLVTSIIEEHYMFIVVGMLKSASRSMDTK